MIKQIPIKNVKILSRLDKFAEELRRMPHSFRALPKADLTFKKLKEHMADADFVGYPKSHNYQDYSGQVAKLLPGQQVRRLRTEKHWFLQLFKAGMDEELYQRNSQWYFDTVTVMPPRWGHTGWHNCKNKPRRFISFIHNEGSGYSIMVNGKKQVTIKDQRRVHGAGCWTCIEGFHPADGSAWFADTNTGASPRTVIDMSLPERYQEDISGAIKLITTY